MKCQSCKTPMSRAFDPLALTTTHACPDVTCPRGAVVTRDAGVQPQPAVYVPGAPLRSGTLDEETGVRAARLAGPTRTCEVCRERFPYAGGPTRYCPDCRGEVAKALATRRRLARGVA